MGHFDHIWPRGNFVQRIFIHWYNAINRKGGFCGKQNQDICIENPQTLKEIFVIKLLT